MELENQGGLLMSSTSHHAAARSVDLPFGFRFVPTDQELIHHYLKKKINNEPIAYDMICTVNVYKHNPLELTGYYPSLGENEWYFFTPRDRKYQNGIRPNRAAGNGYWKATIADKPIYDNKVCIGFKKTLVFYERNSPKDKKTNWIMHEYVVDRQKMGSTKDMLLDNCVLCRIYYRSHGASKDDEKLQLLVPSISCQIHEEQETAKCFENENLQQHNIPMQCNLDPVLQSNLPIQQQSLPAQQYDLLQAENDDRGGWLNYCMGSTSGSQKDYENIENGLDMISNGMDNLCPDASLMDYFFGDNN